MAEWWNTPDTSSSPSLIISNIYYELETWNVMTFSVVATRILCDNTTMVINRREMNLILSMWKMFNESISFVWRRRKRLRIARRRRNSNTISIHFVIKKWISLSLRGTKTIRFTEGTKGDSTIIHWRKEEGKTEEERERRDGREKGMEWSVGIEKERYETSEGREGREGEGRGVNGGSNLSLDGWKDGIDHMWNKRESESSRFSLLILHFEWPSHSKLGCPIKKRKGVTMWME